MIIARRKRFFRDTLANFCKSKKCIIFNVDHRPGLKKSKFDMILIGHSPFKVPRIEEAFDFTVNCLDPFIMLAFIYIYFCIKIGQYINDSAFFSRFCDFFKI